MTVDNLIVSTLAPLERPIFRHVYESKNDNSGIRFFNNIDLGYFVFNYVDERGVVFGDDRKIIECTTLYLHFYTRTAELLKTETECLLAKAGVSVSYCRREYENDTGYTHLTYLLEINTTNGGTII